MTADRDREFGFAPAHDAPIPYLQRIRTCYRPLGYGAPKEQGGGEARPRYFPIAPNTRRMIRDAAFAGSCRIFFSSSAMVTKSPSSALRVT